ncbi:MAG TPA: adenylyltransferase/cytidyltransferase family protein [Patescibacteria group bacterium]|nr:adenylyltransferase/cytidyltransferase family protein [Patescibacteria group bacterium]
MIITLNDLASVRERHKGQKIVLTSGTFDLLHTGHLDYLEKVEQYGNIVIVLLSGDNRTKARKGSNRPIIPEQDRAKILDCLTIVDYVFIDPSKLSPDQTDSVHSEILNTLKPDYYVTDGADPRFVDIMDKSKFIILERMHAEPSTTSIIKQIIDSS